MSTPEVTITKADFQTGSAAPSPVGVLAIIAPANKGPVNTPASYALDSAVNTDFGPGPLTEDSSYTIATGGKPVVPIRPTTATAASYGAVDHSGVLGTAVPTAGAAVPTDNYPVRVDFVDGGTVGASGITYTYSLDGGVTKSAKQALPPGAAPISMVLPNFSNGGSPGVSFSIAAGTILAGDFFTCPTLHAAMNDADLATSLEALRVYGGNYEGVLIDQDIASTTPGLVDTWLSAQERKGKFKFALLNTRLKNQATPETETAYATAMATLMGAAAPSSRQVIGSDGGKLTSTLTGLTLPRPTSLAVAARAMRIPIGEDPAYVGGGNVGGYTIVDSRNNPAFHNEDNYPGLDDLLLSTLRSVHGQVGVYITNARVFSQVGSDYVFLPQLRCMNRACEIAYQVLTTQLGKGVGKGPRDPQTGKIVILEADAMSIDGIVRAALANPLKDQVAGYLFRTSRTDDVGANSGAVLSGSMAISSLVYIKGFAIVAAFVRTISVGA